MKTFNPTNFLALIKPLGTNGGYTVEHEPENKIGCIAENISIYTDRVTHVIAIVDTQGNWVPVAESPSYPRTHVANTIRRVAYMHIIGTYPTDED